MCHRVFEVPRPPPQTPSQLGPPATYLPAPYPPADADNNDQPQTVVRPVPRNGLQNLGNTCYLNAAIQMLRSIPSLQRALQPYARVPLVAEYLDVLQQLDQPGPLTVRPHQLKAAIAQHCSYFNNDQQHDAHELLEVLLSALDKQLLAHASLSAAPATQSQTNTATSEHARAECWWRQHVRSVHPLMVNLLHGQLSNWTQCPNCPSPVTSYEPFTMLSVPVLVDKEQQNTQLDSDKDKQLVVVGMHSLGEWVLVKLTAPPNLPFTTQAIFDSFDDPSESITYELLLIDTEKVTMRMLPSTEVLPQTEGSFPVVYCLPPIPKIEGQETLLFIVTQYQSNESGTIEPLPVWPIVLRYGVWHSDSVNDLVHKTMKKVHSTKSLNRSHCDYVLRRWSSGSLLCPSEPIQYTQIDRNDRRHPERLIHPTDRSPNSRDRIVMLNVLWQPDAHQRHQFKLDLPELRDYKQPMLDVHLGGLATEQLAECSIEDCLRALFKPDLVTGDNAWACPDCAPVKVEATRWSRLHRAPQNLILHLKRFNNNSQKLLANVTYPIHVLNVGEFTGVQTDQYQLQAVICHLGDDPANGHYVCVARDPQQPQQFNLHDDGRVELDCDPHRPRDVYLLLYQRITQHDPQHSNTLRTQTQTQTAGTTLQTPGLDHMYS